MKQLNWPLKAFYILALALIVSPLSKSWAQKTPSAQPISAESKLTLGLLSQNRTKIEPNTLKKQEEILEKDKGPVLQMLKDARYKALLIDQTKIKNKQFENGGWGGGNTIRRFSDERPILLDFFIANVAFQDTSFKNQPLIDTPYLKYAGRQPIKVQELDAYPQAKALIERWRRQNKGLVEMLLTALDNLTIEYIFRSVPLADGETFYLPGNLRQNYRGGLLTPVVAYHQIYGLRISAPEWNRLGDLSQSGLLIHEALRRIQLSYGLTVSPEKLQALTAAIALENPETVSDLETTKYLDQKLLLEIRRVSSRKISPNLSKENLCKIEKFDFSTSPGIIFYASPTNYIKTFCEYIADIDLVEDTKEIRHFFCETKSIKKFTLEQAVKAWLSLKIQVYEQYRTNSDSSGASSSLHIDTSMSEMGLRALTYISSTPAKFQTDWQKWKNLNCTNPLPLTQKDILEVLKFPMADADIKGPLVEMLAKTYVSLSKAEPFESTSSYIERRGQEEKEKARVDRDALGKELIQSHLEGKVSHPEFLHLVRGYRAIEEYLRLTDKQEFLDF
ncbi:MAG: hypothetical protein WA160_10160 [Pseudobdellovibrio sp.]